MRALRHVGLLVQQREGPLGARQVPLQARRLPAHRLQGLVQLPQVPEHHQELSQRERARTDVAHSDEQHRRHAQRRHQADEQAVATLQHRQPDARGDALARAMHEAPRLPRFLAERLDHPQRPERLLDDGERRAFELLHLARLAAHARAVQPGQEEQWRGNRQRHDGELPVEVGRDDPHRDHGDRG